MSMKANIESVLTKLKALVLKGKYKEAMEIAGNALKLQPKNFELRFQYAKLLGDWADELPIAKKKKAKDQAIRILRPLLRSLSGKKPELRFGICLNYYYQSENFKGMYGFGRRLIANKNRNGYYASGVGASHEAFRLHQARKLSQAKNWTKKAIASWKSYGLAREKYYFPHYCEAMAFALNGENQKAMKSLKNAARLSHRTVQDWEFSDVLKLI